MRWRVALAHILIRAGTFVRSLALMVMRPDDLIAFGRQSYSTPRAVESWSAEGSIEQGLREEERWLLDRTPVRQGELLLLGVGGGREAIPLAQSGFSVTGVDFVPEMVERARRNAACHGISFKGLVQEISSLAVPADSYAVAWMSSEMYSCIPTKKRRLAMLARINQALRGDGYFICQFRLHPPLHGAHVCDALRTAVAWLTLGNLSHENGDGLWGESEFVHAFPSEEAVKSEFSQAGFTVAHFHVPTGSIRAGAILRKSASPELAR